jgi:hypothetical protein
MGLACAPNPDVGSSRVCELAKCPPPILGVSCCTPFGFCGWDPLASGQLCFPNPPTLNVPDGGFPDLCDLERCPSEDAAGKKACCQPNGQCGIDVFANGTCFPPPPPPTCDISKCTTTENGPRTCCQLNGQCGLDVLGIGLCFPPPVQLCDLAACPDHDSGIRSCCMLNGQCGLDALGIGLCFPPPPEPTCALASCPSIDGIRPCCLPNGQCGLDSLGIGVCFLPPPPIPDGGIPTGPPNDPSITGACPSFLGLFGPVWGCCSDFGVCGTFAADTCLLPVGSQIPNGPPPPPAAGVTEPFLRCTPPARP